jgi:hypothetical protein
MPSDTSATLDLTPFSLASTKASIKESINKFVEEETEKLRKKGKRLTSKKNQELTETALYSTIKAMCSDENTAENILVMANAAVNSIGEQAKNMDNLIDFVSYYVCSNQK